MLAPLMDEEQLSWINELIKVRKSIGKDTSDLEQYRHSFQSLQKNDDIKGLLEIPILLRMIVQNCYEPSSDNRVDLYRNLFNKTLLRQGIEDKRDQLQSVYRQIAFRIFVYDDDSAELNKGEFKDITGSDAYLYQYYLHTPEIGAGQDREGKYRVTFLHRSFYQYFLSEFLYEKFKAITDVQSGKNFLKYLWARHLDNYVLDNFCYMARGVNTACKCVLSAIEETDAILPTYENVSDSKEHIGNYDMANNVFWNAVSTCCSLFQKEKSQGPLDLKGRIAGLLSRYTCFGIVLKRSSLYHTNLYRADLHYADLRSTNLSSANLGNANLRGATLSHADLSYASLHGADLRGADLSYTGLYHANLSGADLRGVNLHTTHLWNANLESAKFSRSQFAYLSTKDIVNLYKIIVVDDE